ncbi:MAG: hypothetical protein LC792_25280, partial [Actinobacteria bacterium]|nr:hypothetical protein [Actinomycetota bacterium]
CMDPFLVTQLAEQHHRDLVGLAQAEHAVRRARQGGDFVRPWRHSFGQFLVTLGVGVGLPRQRRSGALRQARALLADECIC